MIFNTSPVRWGLLIALSLLLLNTACRPQARISPLPAGSVILAFGDSLTFGTGSQASENYPAQLEGLLQRRVINAGVPGEISAQGLKRLPQLLEKHRPQLVILCHGGNDFLQRRNTEHLIENLRSMIEMARRQGADVVLVGVPQPGLLLQTAELYEDLAEDYRLPYEGEILRELLSSREFKSDAVHPNATGYRRLAETLAGLIEKAQQG